jgi:hypothetical protein
VPSRLGTATRIRAVRRTLVSLVVVTALLAVPASALAFYGSIAINPQTEAYGGSYNQPTKRAAERTALRKCQGQCRTLLWVRNYCAAAVVTPKGFWGGFGATHNAAIRAARRHARAPKAKFLTWICTG